MLSWKNLARAVVLSASWYAASCASGNPEMQEQDIRESSATLATRGHSGESRNSCPPGPRCLHGKCCPEGLTNCHGSCVDVETNAANCGACGSSCDSGNTCTGGLCCPEGQTNCGGSCIDLEADVNNCGACGSACGLGACSGGLCCSTGTTNCNGACFDLMSSQEHCGTCDTSCSPGQACSNGQCITPMTATLSPRETSFTFARQSPHEYLLEVRNTGTAPTGPLSVTNSDPTDFFANFRNFNVPNCPGLESLPPGGVCSMSLVFNPPTPGLHTADVTVSAIPGGTIAIHLTGRGMLFDGQTGCTDSLDCPPDCAPCPDGIACPPCQGGTCLAAFHDLDMDGYGSLSGPTTVCNRILPWSSASYTANDCDDGKAMLFPGASVCDPGHAHGRIVCGDDGSLETQTCTDGPCVDGQCSGVVPPCLAGQTSCDGACFDLQISNLHCGACATICASDQLCVDGQCVAEGARLVFGNSPLGGSSTTSVTFPLPFGDIKTYVYFTNTGNVPSGPISVTNSDPQNFPGGIFACLGPTIEPGELCSLQVFFTPRTPGLHTAELSVAATPGGIIKATLMGRGMVNEGQTGCTDSLDCPPDCAPCPIGVTCPPCQGGTCLTAFYDSDMDGYGTARGRTTVCNRILPWSIPRLSLAFNDCDDTNAAVFPGVSICSPTDPNVRITCRDNASLDIEACSPRACANGQCGGAATTGGQ